MMKSSCEKMRRMSRIFCTLVTHSIPTMARARMPTRLTLPISRTSWILGKIRVEKGHDLMLLMMPLKSGAN